MAEASDQYNLEPEAGASPGDRPREAASQEKPGVAAGAARTAKIEAPSILQLEDDACPKCHAPLDKDAVVCMKCGYDLRANTVREPDVGVEYVAPPEDAKAGQEEFSKPGRGDVRTIGIVGGFVMLGAMIAAGVNAPPHFVPVSSRVIQVLYETLLHTGTGVVAVALAARLSEMRLGNVELAAARVLTAFAMFQLLTHLGLPGPVFLVKITLFLLGATAYWGLVMLLFTKSRAEALLVTLIHLILWIVVQLGSVLTAWADRYPLVSAAGAAGAGG